MEVGALNESFLIDIESQPQMIRAALPRLRSQVGPISPTGGRVLITGSGDSYIAALAVEGLYRSALDQEARAIPAIQASRFEELDGATVVIVSVSGGVSRAIEVAARADMGTARTVAVTANPNSSLAELVDHVVVLPTPLDRSIPHARDFTATLAGLAVVLEALSSSHFEQLEAWPEVAEACLSMSWDWARSLRNCDDLVWFLGAGPDKASAMYGALKYWEAGGMPAWWDDLEEFAHGSQLMCQPGQAALIVVPGAAIDRALEMIPGFEQMGVDTSIISTSGGVPVSGIQIPALGNDDWSPFVSCFPLQVLTYVDAANRGLDVSVPLGGRPHGGRFLDVHRAWTKESRVVADMTTRSTEDAR